MLIKNEQDLMIEVHFTCYNECRLELPSMGDTPAHQETLDKSNNFSCVFKIDRGYKDVFDVRISTFDSNLKVWRLVCIQHFCLDVSPKRRVFRKLNNDRTNIYEVISTRKKCFEYRINLNSYLQYQLSDASIQYFEMINRGISSLIPDKLKLII